MSVRIQIEIKNLPQIKSAFKKAPALMTKEMDIAIKKSIFLIQRNSQIEAPVRTGRLRSSAYTKFDILRGETGFNTNYAEAVHEGVSPYIIRPRSRKALFWKGAAHPVRSVSHPGMRANPFLKRGVDKSERSIDGFFDDAVNKVLDKIAEESE